jgi:hypothetical protein
MKQYMIVAYACVVKAGHYNLEPIEGSTLPIVPEAYRVAVAEYLITSNPV